MKNLINAAKEVRKNAHAIYSNYRVGAAVLTDDDKIITGCNVESSSYGLSCCAERTALFCAVSEGHHDFKALAIVTKDGGSPCGACRQIIWDLCGDIPIYISDENGNIDKTTSKELLPNAFDDSSLK